MNPKTDHLKVERGVWQHIKADTVWKSFPEFLRASGLRPTPKHRFKRPDKAQPFGPSNGGWHFTHPPVPEPESTAPEADLEGASSGPFTVRGYHGHGLWHMVCRTCHTEQIRPPESACLACGAQADRLANDLPTAAAIRDKKARNARFYYARAALKSPTHFKNEDSYKEFWGNLPEGKPAQIDYVLNYWEKL